MKQHDTTPPDPESEKGVRKSAGTAASKFAPAYWQPRVFRPSYGDGTVSHFYVQMQFGGRREKAALGTNSREEAGRIAARLYKAVAAKGWDAALAEVLPGQVERRDPNAKLTFGAALEQAMEAKRQRAVASKKGIRQVTLEGYAVNARQLVALAAGIDGGEDKYDYVNGGRDAWLEEIHAVPLARIKTEDMQAALDAKIAAAQGNDKQRSAKRTCAATVREAKALFKGQDWNPFAGLKVANPPPAAYNGTLDLGSIVRAGLKDLKGDTLAALLLFAGCGLRRSEADNARWDWIDSERATITVRGDSTFTPKSHASESPVWIDRGFIAELLKLKPRRAKPGDFILAPKVPPPPPARFARYRASEPFAKLTAWLRGQGVTSRTPIHDLRREFGSFIAQHADIFTASRQLRHSSIAVTASHYAAQRRHVAPELGAILAPKAEGKQ